MNVEFCIGLYKHQDSAAHRQCVEKYTCLKNSQAHIEQVFEKQDKVQSSYSAIALETAVDVTMHLAKQGLSFRGDDESENSLNRGNFIETREFLKSHSERIDHGCKNAHMNQQYVSSTAQKEICKAAASLITEKITREVKAAPYFSLVADECCDIDVTEWMSINLRYPDVKGAMVEHFLVMVHVSDTSAITLFSAIKEELTKLGIDVKKLRGQGNGTI